jgi:hypothetical protein
VQKAFLFIGYMEENKELYTFLRGINLSIKKSKLCIISCVNRNSIFSHIRVPFFAAEKKIDTKRMMCLREV